MPQVMHACARASSSPESRSGSKTDAGHGENFLAVRDRPRTSSPVWATRVATPSASIRRALGGRHPRRPKFPSLATEREQLGCADIGSQQVALEGPC